MTSAHITEDDQYLFELRIILDCLHQARRAVVDHNQIRKLNIQLLVVRYPRLSPDAKRRAIASMWNCLGQITDTQLSATTTRLIQAIL